MNDARETRRSRMLRTRSGGVLRAAIHAWALLPLLAVAAPEGDAPQPAKPDIVTPSSTNTGEAGAPSVSMATVEQRNWLDRLDLGFGLNVGAPPGVELRVLGLTDAGFVVGASLRAATVVLFSEAGGQVIAGWEFRDGKDRGRRAYGTFGASRYLALPIFGSSTWGTEIKVGFGYEWKTSKEFGLGFSGGMGFPRPDGGGALVDMLPVLWGGLDFVLYIL